jgi:magnesium chelatase family protein
MGAKWIGQIFMDNNMLKRALEIAAAGGHNVILVGPPGSGKTSWQRPTQGYFPQLSEQKAMR